MSSLLYLCNRPEKIAADAEHRSFQRALGVETLARHDLVGHPLRDIPWQDYDGIVVGGSPFNVTDAKISAEQAQTERDLELVARHAIDGGTPVFFTCYGIGVVTRMLGGSVDTDHSEAAQAAVSDVTAEGATDPVFGPSAPSFTALSAHKEGSAAAPPGAVLLATNSACPAQAYRVGTGLYATQFHPEASPQDFVERMALYRSLGYFAPEEYDRLASIILATAPDGSVLLRRFADLVGA